MLRVPSKVPTFIRYKRGLFLLLQVFTLTDRHQHYVMYVLNDGRQTMLRHDRCIWLSWAIDKRNKGWFVLVFPRAWDWTLTCRKVCRGAFFPSPPPPRIREETHVVLLPISCGDSPIVSGSPQKCTADSILVLAYYINPDWLWALNI